MKAKDIIYKAMKTRNYTQSTLAEVAGFKRVSNVSEILRSQNMRIDNFVKLLNAMGYDVIVKGEKEKWNVTLSDDLASTPNNIVEELLSGIDNLKAKVLLLKENHLEE